MTAAAMPELPDDAVRRRIRECTGETLFVNAGAGSGKTTALVGRVTTLVLRDGVPLRSIAAVTFTERAGAELRDRLRAVFEREWRAGGETAERADAALDDLDGAAIGTLHSFAQRILGEHPIEAGLPPILDVLDEVGSSVAFDERWSGIQSRLLDDDAIAPALLWSFATGTTLDHLRSLTQKLGADWDLIDDRVLASPPAPLAEPDVADFVRRAREVCTHRDHCADDTDRLHKALCEFAAAVDDLGAAVDTETRLSVLRTIGAMKFSHGQRANWLPKGIENVRAEALSLAAEAKRRVDEVADLALRHLTVWLARAVLQAAEARRREGALEFHDLLVLARDVLRRDPSVRAALHDAYRRILLDEFQDTDPIQIELAARICGGEHADAADWRDIAIAPGRLFVVGDAKQSIYRFRRADIQTYLRAQQHIGSAVELTANFRSVAPVLDWVNAVFERVIQHDDDRQPPYRSLAPVRAGVDPGPSGSSGPSVTVLGADEHPDEPRADALREREADDVAAVVRRALDEGWQVWDEAAGRCRAAVEGDIAVLVPSRTSLPFLETAFERAGVQHRAEASSLVYHAAEVRSLLACARAVADTSDALALVTALRSPLFGCGDDDLWGWKHAGGAFSVFAPSPGDPSTGGPSVADGPVAQALGELRELFFASRWLTPGELLARIVADRRMFEVAATGTRPRDVWRQLRFVVDQARAWSEVSHGGLRAYLAWAGHQGQEASRVAEAVLPETDNDAVRVMTVHAAKGLEFPIVVLSGMTAQQAGSRGVSLLWPPAGGYSVKLKSGVQTDDWQMAAPIDEQMDELEKRRLLYVAATRARDHLVVSLHRRAGGRKTAATILAEAGAASVPGACRFEGAGVTRPVAPPAVATPPPPWEEWSAAVSAARGASRRAGAITASGLEGTEPEVTLAAAAVRPGSAADGDEPAAVAAEPAAVAEVAGEPAAVVEGRAKGARDLDLPPWSKGRYGSAIGRAVHAVLQTIDLATGTGADDAVLAQAVAEGVTGTEQLVHRLVQSALASPTVARAAAREHWRETYVGTTRPDGTVLEGYIDLVYREDDGTLAVVDYKTDAVPDGGVPARVRYYEPQLRAYREALEAATGERVTTTLLFLHPDAPAVAVPVP